jgi:hypothetical protein
MIEKFPLMLRFEAFRIFFQLLRTFLPAPRSASLSPTFEMMSDVADAPGNHD